jgi:hypothetical protein
LTVATIPSKIAAKQIAALRGRAKASLFLAVDEIRRQGQAAGVRLSGAEVSAVCRRDLYGQWRLLTAFETVERCYLLLVERHLRTANPYQLLYRALGIEEPIEPRTKPACCDDGYPPVDPELIRRFERGARDLLRRTDLALAARVRARP